MKRPTKDQIRELPLYVGLALSDIHIIETELDAVNALQVLKKEVHLGFDTESKPTFRKGDVSKGPTVIQLATDTTAFLFLTRFPPALKAAKDILDDDKIQKIGFGLKGDKKELRSKFDINIVNTKDLAVTLKNLTGDKDSIGARAAVAMVLKFRLGKGAQKSNWGAYPLKKNQILYAANDAYSAICIENTLSADIKRIT